MSDTLNAIGFVNTQVFRPAASYFDKYGRYDDGVFGTYENDDYWTEEHKRCLEGFSSGGIRISGYHYFYLNYCRIQIVEKKERPWDNTYGEVHQTKAKKARKVGKRTEEFPAFWDEDFAYFTTLDIAENGIAYEVWQNLPIHLSINPNFLSGGHHLMYLKPRGVGASWKAGGCAARNFCLMRDSKSYMIANEKEFLTKDGVLNKFLSIKDWLIKPNGLLGYSDDLERNFFNAEGIGKVSEVKKDSTEMHYRASVVIDGVEQGFMSEVFGVSLNNNWQKARGKRGQLILWEEMGKFPNADLAWEVARPSVEEGDTNFGTMIGFGTGGTKDANFEALKNIFFDPEQYNVIAFDNVWDDGATNTLCGFFTPAYRDVAFKDSNGNSNEDLGRAYYDSERELAKKAKDPTLLPRKKAEKPYNPREAVLQAGNNLFMSDTLIRHRDNVRAHRWYETQCAKGILERDGATLKFKVKDSLIPIHEYPHKNKYADLDGAVLIYQEPYKRDGVIPKDLYKICVDTYRHDQTSGDSIGSIYVIKQLNNFTEDGGDVIVACYNARPAEQEDFNKILFLLAEYYDAEIAFENDEPGDVVGYAKRHKKLQMLADEFELAFDEDIKTSVKSKRSFGMHMGSGKENRRKNQGDLFIKRWLYTIRYTRANGENVLNLHTIKDLGLLEEFCSYNPDGNFDRISAFRIGMYHQRELEYNEIVPTERKATARAKFFEKELF